MATKVKKKSTDSKRPKPMSPTAGLKKSRYACGGKLNKAKKSS